MTPFLGGIRDADGTRAYMPVAAGDIAAIDLERGSLLWRRGRAGRPVAATASRVIALDSDAQAFVLRVLAAADGAEIAVARDLGMPPASAGVASDPEAVAVHAAETPEGLRLTWRVRQRYRGGAPPPREIAAAARGESSGTILLDPENGEARPASAGARGAAPPLEDTTPAALSSDDPQVIALDRVGGRSFALRIRAADGRSIVTLEARDDHGAVLWEQKIDERTSRGPGPLRK